jgi:hypothetical protein
MTPGASESISQTRHGLGRSRATGRSLEHPRWAKLAARVLHDFDLRRPPPARSRLLDRPR